MTFTLWTNIKIDGASNLPRRKRQMPVEKQKREEKAIGLDNAIFSIFDKITLNSDLPHRKE